MKHTRRDASGMVEGEALVSAQRRGGCADTVGHQSPLLNSESACSISSLVSTLLTWVRIHRI